MGKYKKIIIFFTIISLVFFIPKLKKAEAVWWQTIFSDFPTTSTSITSASGSASQYSQTSLTWKEFYEKIKTQVLKSIAKRVLAKMTEATVNWINSGFEGKPLFMENTQSFMKNLAKEEIKGFIDQIGYDKAKFPFGKNFALNMIDASQNYFQKNVEYSMNKMYSEAEIVNFKADFSDGGWDAWLAMTMLPQNNYIGFNLLAAEEVTYRLTGIIEPPAETFKKELDWAQGFISPQICTDETYVGKIDQEEASSLKEEEERWKSEMDAMESEYEGNTEGLFADESYGELEDEYARTYREYQDYVTTHTCPKTALKTTTPGGLVADQIKLALGSKFRQSELGQALGNSMSVIFDALLQKLMTEAGEGLKGLMTKNKPEVTDVPDKWTYEDQKLGISSNFYGAETETEEGNPNTETVNSDGFDWEKVDLLINPDELKDTLNQEIITTLKYVETTKKIIDANKTNLPEKIMQLDKCLPGPDFGWERKLDKEVIRNDSKYYRKADKKNEEKAYIADYIVRGLNQATAIYKEWVKDYMILELPSSDLMISEIEKLKENMKEINELKNDQKESTYLLKTIIRLKSSLDEITSKDEKDQTIVKSPDKLISLYKQHDSLIGKIPTEEMVEEKTLLEEKYKEKLIDLDRLSLQCSLEKQQELDSDFNEKSFFCEKALVGGASHGSVEEITIDDASEDEDGKTAVFNEKLRLKKSQEIFLRLSSGGIVNSATINPTSKFNVALSSGGLSLIFPQIGNSVQNIQSNVTDKVKDWLGFNSNNTDDTDPNSDSNLLKKWNINDSIIFYNPNYDPNGDYGNLLYINADNVYNWSDVNINCGAFYSNTQPIDYLMAGDDDYTARN